MKSFENIIPEIQSTPEVVETRLELEHRNKLQHHIIRKSLGDTVSDSNVVYEWTENNLPHISAIIDSPDCEDIRALARAGKYEEAAIKVLALL